jgi:SNF2 family DNA or RNA helicase
MLRQYQKDLLLHFKNSKSFGLFWDMRLGKTKTIITYIKQHKIYPCLIVSPYSAFLSWQKEVPDISIVSKDIKITGGMDFFLTNKESHLWLPKEVFEDFNTIILDESSFIKNPKARVSKFFLSLKNPEHRFCLTGTPAPESDLDYINQLNFINALPINYWQFRHWHCVPINYKWIVRDSGKKIIANALQKHCHFLSKKDVNLENEKEHIVRYVIPNKKWLKIYNKLNKEFVLEYQTYEKETNLLIEKFLLMRQLCSGFINNKFIDDFSFKIDELIYLLTTELKGQQAIIYCQYINELYLIFNTFQDIENIDLYKSKMIYGKILPEERIKILNEFREGKLQYLIVQPETFKFGVDASCCDNLIYYSSPLGWETRIQSEARIDMPLKTTKNLIFDIVIKNSIEEYILKSLKKKENRQQLIRRMVQC